MNENINQEKRKEESKIFVRPKVFKSNVIFYDNNGKIVSKEKGCRAHILELDENDNIINSVWGTYDNNTFN